MDLRKHIYFRLVVVTAPLWIWGCAGYGKLGLQTKTRDAVTIEHLVSSQSAYHVYYSGYAIDNAAGVLFDPKDDERTLMVSRAWERIQKDGEVSEAVRWASIPALNYKPELYRVLGPDGQFFGYLYTGWLHAVLKAIDPQTLFVYGLDPPPQYLEEGFDEKNP